MTLVSPETGLIQHMALRGGRMQALARAKSFRARHFSAFTCVRVRFGSTRRLTHELFNSVAPSRPVCLARP